MAVLWSGAPHEWVRSLSGSRNDIPVLVDFRAPWCGPCKMLAPQFEQAAAQLEPHVKLAKINTEAEPELDGQFGLRSISARRHECGRHRTPDRGQ